MSIGSVTISAAVTWIIAVCAAIATVFKAVEILRGLSGKTKIAERLSKHDELIENANRRLVKLEECTEEQQEAQAVMFRAILSQINHALTGNGNEKLKEARDEIQAYLTNR